MDQHHLAPFCPATLPGAGPGRLVKVGDIMHFERLCGSQHALYGQAMELYGASFPLHEQRPALSQAAALRHPEYHFELIFEGPEWVGLLLCWHAAQFIYVEHFCIRPQLRGRQYGQKAMELLAAQAKPIILEIDPPVDEVSLRRRGFYQRAGYHQNSFPHRHPPYRQGYQAHPLVVMSYPGPLGGAQYQAFAQYLRHTVMGL